ncbi:hypothetical protein COOONC_20213 [Cooperia oncophora]
MLIIAGMTGYRHPRKMVNEVLRQLRMTSHCRKSFNRLRSLSNKAHSPLPEYFQYVCSSGGQKRKISAGVAILSDSNLLVLDEPTAGIDPKVWFARYSTNSCSMFSR